MNPPKRWIDDPQFIAATGIDLADEQLEPVDLDALKARVMAAVDSPQSPPSRGGSGGTSWRGPLLGSVFGSTLLLGWLVWSGPMGTTATHAQIVQPSPPVAQPVTLPSLAPPLLERSVLADSEAQEEVVVLPVDEGHGTDLVNAEADGALQPDSTGVTHAEVVSATATPATPTPTASIPAASDPIQASAEPLAMLSVAPEPEPEPEIGEPPPEPSSDLADEAEVLRVADQMLEDGYPDDAAGMFNSYLQRWPEGRLKAEARLGLLESYTHAHDWSAAEALSAELLQDPWMQSRRVEVAMVRGHALLAIGECDEGVSVLKGIDVRDADLKDARRSCHQMTRSGH